MNHTTSHAQPLKSFTDRVLSVLTYTPAARSTPASAPEELRGVC